MSWFHDTIEIVSHGKANAQPFTIGRAFEAFENVFAHFGQNQMHDFDFPELSAGLDSIELRPYDVTSTSEV